MYYIYNIIDSESSTPAPKNTKHQKHKPQSQYVI